MTFVERVHIVGSEEMRHALHPRSEFGIQTEKDLRFAKLDAPERRRILPQPLLPEAEDIAVVCDGLDDIADGEYRRGAVNHGHRVYSTGKWLFGPEISERMSDRTYLR
jgi:hypothetical protein